MKRQMIRLALFVFAAQICGLSPLLAAQYVDAKETPERYIVFDVGTPVGIDAQGTVTGYSSDNCTSFYRLADGKIVNFAVAGAKCSKNGYPGTLALNINAGGTIVGTYFDGVTTGGFLRDPKGNFTKFSVPNSTDTLASSVNSSGEVAGAYVDSSGTTHGFLRDSQGNFSLFDLVDFYSFVGRQYPHFSINARGNIAGWYEGTTGPVGFLRETGGKFTLLTVPHFDDVYVAGIDDAGRIFGNADDGDDFYAGFVRDQFGNYTFIDFPNTTQLVYDPICKDHNGTLVGNVGDDGSFDFAGGFYQLIDGKIVLFDPPGSISTWPTAVDPQGDITGYFFDANFAQHAFIRLAQ